MYVSSYFILSHVNYYIGRLILPCQMLHQIKDLFKSNTTCLMRLKVHYCDQLSCIAIQVKIAWDHPLAS